MIEFSRRRSHEGFSLVELLVSMAVFTLLAVMIFAVVGQANGVWRQAQSQIEPRKTGRSILDYIAKELGMAALPRNRSMLYTSNAASPLASDLNLQFVSTPSVLGASHLNPQAIFWQAPIATGTSGGIAEVGYFIRWDESNPANPRAMLCRFFVNPDDSDYLIYSSSKPWLSDDLLEAVAPGVKDNATPANSYKGWFADNVIALWVRCIDPNGNPIVTNALGDDYSAYAYDSRKGYQYKTAFTTGTTINKSGFKDSNGNYNLLATLPASVEIVLVILDPRAANRLTAKPTYTVTSPPTVTSFWTDIDTFTRNLPAAVRGGARIYSTRVSLNNPSGN